MGNIMPDLSCTEKIYSEDYLDYLVEYFAMDESLQNLECINVVNKRYAVFYQSGSTYQPRDIYVIPHCYGLLSSDQVLESTGVARVQRQPGQDLYGRGVLVGFVDTGERVTILSS